MSAGGKGCGLKRGGQVGAICVLHWESERALQIGGGSVLGRGTGSAKVLR